MRTLLWLVLILGACNGAEDDKDSDEPAAGDPVEDMSAVQDVFNRNCILCHVGSGAPEGMALTEADAYDNIVGVDSEQDASLARIEPGDPDSSYLWLKVTGEGMNEKMPKGGQLSDEDLDTIEAWILAGAPE